jgi:tRNA A-37 threonylcarbamoyl transferase component Bud32
VYRFFRKSKAKRSFEYALKLEKMGVGTPKPVAYFEFPKGLFFDRSFYVSVQLQVDFTFKEFLLIHNHPLQDDIITAVTKFTYQMHELGIHFLDHTSGNTLIRENQGHYDCFLVDLNRMNFNQKLSYEKRIQNLCKLTNNLEVLKKIAAVYAGFMSENVGQTQMLLTNYSNAFFNKFHQKKKLKKKLLFWKK